MIQSLTQEKILSGSECQVECRGQPHHVAGIIIQKADEVGVLPAQPAPPRAYGCTNKLNLGKESADQAVPAATEQDLLRPEV